jgi:hypothetical protein
MAHMSYELYNSHPATQKEYEAPLKTGCLWTYVECLAMKGQTRLSHWVLKWVHENSLLMECIVKLIILI